MPCAGDHRSRTVVEDSDIVAGSYNANRLFRYENAAGKGTVRLEHGFDRTGADAWLGVRSGDIGVTCGEPPYCGLFYRTRLDERFPPCLP